MPQAEGRSGFVWTLVDDEAQRMGELGDAQFLRELQTAFGFRLGEFSAVGTRVSYRLALTRARRLTEGRAVLVGNAAHGLHPVAAQGFNLGVRDVAVLCDCIADVCAARRDQALSLDVGESEMLARYVGWRRRDQQKLVGFTDGLVRLFGNNSAAIRVLRDLGMLGFDLIPGVRSLFARHTMGLAGRLPRLSRGVPLP